VCLLFNECLFCLSSVFIIWMKEPKERANQKAESVTWGGGVSDSSGYLLKAPPHFF